jgi:succinate dehydrogenase/fumarate reductase cytochrome b subunit
MANNTQMNENERGVFKLHGITGYIIAVALLLTILVVLTINAISVQQEESTNYYQINQKLDGLKANSFDNYKHYELVGKEK